MIEPKKNPLLAQGVNDMPGGILAGPSSHSTGKVTSAVEVDLRNLRDLAAWEAPRHLQRALVGVAPGDVVKLLVNGTSETWWLQAGHLDLRGVNVQITADSVQTRDAWTRAVREVMGA